MGNGALRIGSLVEFNVGQGKMTGKIKRIEGERAFLEYEAPNGIKLKVARKLELVRRIEK
jgi:FKBP-type peptidyl-prolyl cis-trans isomerase 2